MANDCSRLMKEALDNYLGIDMRYKLDDTLAALGKQKFSAKQLEGYLTKQGVSPKEIKQSGIFEGMADDNRAISAEDWLGMSGNQKVDTFRVAPEDAQYSGTTLDGKGAETDTYKETLSTVKAPNANRPSLPHFEDEVSPKKSLLGWRRTHVQEIEGKPALVLNEFQSDWAQTERAGRGTFESSVPSKYSEAVQRLIKIEGLTEKEIADSDYRAERLETWLDNELITQADIKGGNKNLVADFPMSEIKHHQFQIVGAIDDALKQGIDTIVIPIERTKNYLMGSQGVTKFYESLNKKVLPDIRSKLEKQGMRINVDKTPYSPPSEFMSRKNADRIIEENYALLNAEAKADLSINELMSKSSYSDKIQALTHVADSYGTSTFTPEFKELSKDPISSIGFSRDYLDKLYDTPTEEAAKVLDDLIAQPWFKEFEKSSVYPFTIPVAQVLNGSASPSSVLADISVALYQVGKEVETNDLWRLTVEEIPNKKVNWDVYGIIGALGLTSMLSGNAEAKEMQNIVSPKPQQEQQLSQVPATRQEAEQGTLQRILSQNKVAPLNEPKGILQQYREMGLISQDEEDAYGFKKDNTILDDYRVDMKRQMPKTIQEQEGNNLSAHRPTRKSGWTIGRGYDLTGRKLNDVISDFKEAGISEGQARAFFNHKPIKINAKQSKALGDIAWREKVDTARRIGLPIDKLNREGFLKVMSLVYRGDIVKGGEGYRGKLYDLAKKGDIKAIDRFVLNDSVKTLKSNVLYNRWKKFDKS